MNKLLILLCGIAYLNADCVLINTSSTGKTDAYEMYLESKTLYQKGEYSSAYDKLNESFNIYNGPENKLYVTYKCINYIPGPYAPIIEKSFEDKVLEFDRLSLGKLIKQYLNPNPYLLIQYQQKRTIVSVLNSKKTGRGAIQNQFNLENFIVNINGAELQFGNIKSGEVKKKDINQQIPINYHVETKELYGYNLFK